MLPRKFLLLFFFLLAFCLAAPAQTTVYYSYDGGGNRTQRVKSTELAMGPRIPLAPSAYLPVTGLVPEGLLWKGMTAFTFGSDSLYSGLLPAGGAVVAGSGTAAARPLPAWRPGPSPLRSRGWLRVPESARRTGLTGADRPADPDPSSLLHDTMDEIRP